MKLIYRLTIAWILFMFIFLFSSSFATDASITSDSSLLESNVLNIGSEACILIDANYGKVLYEKNSKLKLYPASTTKVMTAILTCENCNLQDYVTISYWSVNSVPNTYSRGDIKPGDSFTVEQLLNITMVASANDAAYALAEYIANLNNPNYLKDDSIEAKIAFDNSINIFSEMMNNKAKELGCLDTNFINPNGIHDDNHYSTAYDLALIGHYAYSNSIIKNITAKTNYDMPNSNTESGISQYKSTNQLLRNDENSKYYYSYANGLKTGFTQSAGYCIIATANKGNMDLLAVVLNGYYLEDGTATRENDCINLFNYGFDNFTYIELVQEDDVVRTINVSNATENSRTLDLISVATLDCLIKKGQIIDATPHISLDNTISAPIAKGQVVGSITYNIDGIHYNSDLVASHNVYSSSIMDIIFILLAVFVVLLIFVIILSLPKKGKKFKK